MKNGEARIFKSMFGDTYKIEECIGETLYYTHTNTLNEAINYCKSSNLKIIDTENDKVKNNKTEKLIQELKNLCNALIATSEYNKNDEKNTDVQYWKGDCNGKASAYKISAEQLKRIIDEYE